MPNYLRKRHGDPLPWLLERDEAQPGVPYFALRWLLGRGHRDPEVRAARADVMRSGPIPAILTAQLATIGLEARLVTGGAVVI
jgi:hypothetical protein